jgi:hypothetical protein
MMKKKKDKKPKKYIENKKAVSRRCPPAGSTEPSFNKDNTEIIGQKYMNRKRRRQVAPSYKQFQRMQAEQMKKMMDELEEKAKEVGAEVEVKGATTEEVTFSTETE